MDPESFAAWRPLFGITDEQAMWCVQTADDERAFAQLVRRWRRPIQDLCARMTGDVQCGEDLGQETFIRVFARRESYQPNARFSTWLWRIALNLCYDELRRQHRREASFADGVEGESSAALKNFAAPEPGPDRSLAERERDGLVRWALGQLPETYRTVLVLRHYQDLKFREIADVLEVPEGTVKSRMAEALKQIGVLLKPVLADVPAAKSAQRPTKQNQPEESLIL